LMHMRRTGNALVPKSVVDNIQRLTKRDIRTLSTDELLAVADSIRTARHVSRTQLKFLNQLQEGKVNTYSKAIERDLNRKAPATSGRVQRTIERVFGHAAKSPQARSTG